MGPLASTAAGTCPSAPAAQPEVGMEEGGVHTGGNKEKGIEVSGTTTRWTESIGLLGMLAQGGLTL